MLTTDGHGLLLVQQLAAQWGYLRDPAGTTVWFHLAVATRVHRGDSRARPVSAAAVVAAVAAATAASTPEQIAATSSSPVTYGGIV